MLNNIDQFYSLRKLSVPVVGLLLTLSIIGEHSQPVLSGQIEQVPTSAAEYNNYQATAPQTVGLVSNQKAVKRSTTVARVSPERTQRANFPQKDGLYLFGQSPQPNQLGQGYIVFEKRQGRVKGALYMPSSEFSCFQGTIDKSGELAMTVKALPDAGGASQVATSNTLPRNVNDIDVPSTYAYSVALQDFHQIKNVSASDRRILQMCN